MQGPRVNSEARTYLTSPQNPLLKEIRRSGSKGSLTRDGYAIAEGVHLLQEVRRSRVEIGAVIATESAASRISDLPVTVVPDALFETLTTTESPQGVLALVRIPQYRLEDVLAHHPVIAILDGIQEPGNAGAIVRAAEAFRASGAVFMKGSANPYNPKALRASAGSAFRLPIVHGVEPDDLLAGLSKRGIPLWAAMPRGPSLWSADLRPPVALVIGSEGRGIRPKFLGAAQLVSIPTSGVESLNAAVAAAILLCESMRQRSEEKG
jgi:RNA methyltransferase, TrmH family